MAATAILIATVLISPTHANEPVSLVTGEWPPYFSEAFKHGGFGTRVCTEAFSLAEVETIYTYRPWKRGYEAMLHGEFEGSVAWRRSPERERLFYFSDPIFSDKTVFFYRKGLTFDWEMIEDVGHLIIGGTEGYLLTEELAPIIKKNKGGKLELAANDTANFNKLIRGRIDIFACSESVGRYLLQTQFKPDEAVMVEIHPRQVHTGNLHLIIPKTHPKGEALIRKFNEGLIKLRQSGRYDLLLRQSNRGDYLPEFYRLQQKQ